MNKRSKQFAPWAIIGVFLAVCSVLAIDLSTGKTCYEVAGAHLDTQW